MDNGACSYRRFLKGDDSGFVDLIRDYKDGMILFVNGITSNVHIAEEAVEETFFKLAVKRPVYNGKASFKTWLYTIARNTAYDILKKRKNNAEVSIEECYALLKDEEDLERSYVKEERRITLHRAMNGLKPEHRQVLWLMYFENFSTKECALVMKKSAHAVESVAYRAKAALKEKLEKEGFIYEEL